MSRILRWRGAVTAACIVGSVATCTTTPAYAGNEYEVWLVDQSNSNGKTFGGTIHIYDGDDLTSHKKEVSSSTPTDVIDLGGASSSLCLAQTQANPVRPHMLAFNSTGTHAILSFVASGHVLFLEAATRQPVACFRTEAGAGGARQAHAVWPTGDDRYVLVANQNGKKLERIATDYVTNTFVHQPAATLDLAGCTTPSGLPCQDAVLRPDNAPICPFIASDNGPAFVSLRGGGLFVVDWRSEPMSIVSEYEKAHVPANGCGFVEARGMVYGNAGGATPSNLEQFTVYRVPMAGHEPGGAPNSPAVEVLYNDEGEHRDAHGVAVSKHERYVWVADRARNVAEVFEGQTGSYAGTVDLTSAVSADPTPDLIAISPDEHWLFMSTRGPLPLSGDPHAATGTTPGILIVRLLDAGRTGKVFGLVRISNVDAGGVERADAHGIRVRRK